MSQGKSVTDSSDLNPLGQTSVFKMPTRHKMAFSPSDVARDYNNLVSIIQSNLEVVRKSGKVMANTPEGEALVEAQEACIRAASLSNNVLHLARDRSPYFQELHLKDLVTDVVSFCGEGFGDGREIIVDELLVSEDPCIVGCRASLEHAFVNLIQNAREAMDAGGKLFIQVMLADGYVHLFLTDEGPGLNQQMVDWINTMDAQGLKGRESSERLPGLGLLVVKNIMQKHNGFMTIRQGEGGGVVIILSWPTITPSENIDESASDLGIQTEKKEIKDDSAQDDDEAEDDGPQDRDNIHDLRHKVKKPKVKKTAAMKIPTNKLRERMQEAANKGAVWVVDDNSVTLRSMERLLKALDQEDVVLHRSPTEAVRKFTPQQTPRAIFVAYDMQEMHGMHFIESMDAMLSSYSGQGVSIPIILVSDYSARQFDAIKVPVRTAKLIHLRKPYTVAQLEQILGGNMQPAGLGGLMADFSLPELTEDGSVKTGNLEEKANVFLGLFGSKK